MIGGGKMSHTCMLVIKGGSGRGHISGKALLEGTASYKKPSGIERVITLYVVRMRLMF